MPRKRTQSGAYAQPPAATAGQEYGKGVQEMQLERAMPAPQGSPVTQQIPAAAAQTGAPTQAQPSPQPTLADALGSMQGRMPSGGLLAAPPMRPNDPATAGLSSGPGMGPEAIGTPNQSQIGNWYRRLSQATGNPYFAELARRSNL